MVKTRPVVVISPVLKRRSGLTTVLPLSTTEPRYIMPYHYKLTLSAPLPEPWSATECWVICDHPITVSFERLNLVGTGKDQYGKRKYLRVKVDIKDVEGIRIALKAALGLS